jgi:hypothetical protein
LSPLELQKLLSEADYEDYIESGTLPQTFAQATGEGQQGKLQATLTAKGRGGVLGYRSGGKPTITYSGEASDIRDLVQKGTLPESTGTTADSDVGESESERKNRFDELTSLAAKYGQSSLFGHQDYLKATEQGFSDKEITEYLRANPSMLSQGNVPGKVGGLFEEITRGSVDPSKAITRQQSLNREAAQRSSDDFVSSTDYGKTGINPLYGQSKEFFGDEDYFAAIKSGYSDADVKDYLRANMSQLRGTNVPGGGGLYDKLFGAPKPSRSGGGGNSGGNGGGPVFTLGEGQSAERLGHADVAKAKATGATDAQIRQFLARNVDKLAGSNRPGQGGLFDEYFN